MRSSSIPPPPTRATWLLGRAFPLIGIVLALGAIGLFASQILSAPTPPQPAEISAPVVQPTSAVPLLLPETPLLDDLRRELDVPDEQILNADLNDLQPRPTPQDYTAVEEPTALQLPDRITIPSIDLDADIKSVGWATVNIGDQQVGQWQVPDEPAVGWHDTSAGLGQTGNTVLNGHHNIYGQVFRNLVDVNVGDQLMVGSGDNQFDYVITQTMIVPERGQSLDVRLANAQYIMPTDDERITLITCWPFSGNSHRLLVIAEPQSASPLDQLLSIYTPQ